MRNEDRVLILQEAKWIWSQREIERATSLFSQGLKPTEVALEMNQKVIDVGLLFIHLLDKHKIKEIKTNGNNGN